MNIKTRDFGKVPMVVTQNGPYEVEAGLTFMKATSGGLEGLEFVFLVRNHSEASVVIDESAIALKDTDGAIIPQSTIFKTITVAPLSSDAGGLLYVLGARTVRSPIQVEMRVDQETFGFMFEEGPTYKKRWRAETNRVRMKKFVSGVGKAVGTTLLVAGTAAAVAASAYGSAGAAAPPPAILPPQSYQTVNTAPTVTPAPPPVFLGTLSQNSLDPNAVSNPIGRYGSPISPMSINNPIGKYGSSISPYSATNPLATHPPKLYGRDGKYLGKLSANTLNPESISNPLSPYGSPLSPSSIYNPLGKYGSPLSPYSATNPLATQPPVIKSDDGNYLGDLQ
jgi:hypothetical protein